MQKHVMIILTEYCNLNCSYCFEHFKSMRHISYEYAKEILDKELAADSYNSYIIEFFGGEPFIEFKLMQQLYEYIESKRKNVTYFVTTNGTLVHGEIQHWLYERRNKFVCSLSLDGDKSMHNINRDGSFDSIDLDFFARTWPEQTVKMTISRETLPFLYDGIKFIVEKGLQPKISFAQGIIWEDENLKILENELEKVIDYYIANPKLRPSDLLNKNLMLVDFHENKKWCGMGGQLIAYDTEGKQYPCQAFSPSSLGDRMAKEYVNKTEKDFAFEYTESIQCSKCAIEQLCPNCYGANVQMTGDYMQRNMSLCELQKLIVLASAKYQFKKILMKNKHTDDDAIIMRSIKRLQSI